MVCCIACARVNGEVEALSTGRFAKLVKLDSETSTLKGVELDVSQASTELHQAFVYGEVFIGRVLSPHGESTCKCFHHVVDDWTQLTKPVVCSLSFISQK